MTVSQEDAKLSPAIFTHVNQIYTLQNRSITNSPIDPMKFGGSGEFVVDFEWDHKDGLKFTEASGRLRGEDENGNYAEVEVYKKSECNVKGRHVEDDQD